MREFLNNYLTNEEQNVLFFILIFAIIGFVGFNSSLVYSSNENIQDSLIVDIKKNEKIQYDINKVTVEELCLIPGIGIKKANSIITYRDSVGFTSLTDMLNIKGIGIKRLEMIRGFFYPLENDDEIISNRDFVKSNEKIMIININNANIKELCKIPNIGVKKAEQIIKLREKNNGFKSKEELLQIKGIGKKTFNKISSYIKIGDKK